MGISGGCATRLLRLVKRVGVYLGGKGEASLVTEGNKGDESGPLRTRELCPIRLKKYVVLYTFSIHVGDLFHIGSKLCLE